MKDKITMGSRIRELRKSKHLTQEELAAETGLSHSAIRSYENDYREPNSKAMVALEKYFRVSGDYLRGNLKADSFFENAEKVGTGLDQLLNQFISFKEAFDISSQEKQLVVLPLLETYIKIIISELLVDSTVDLIKLSEFNEVLKVFVSLNVDGQNELLKRCEELSMLPRYSPKK